MMRNEDDVAAMLRLATRLFTSGCTLEFANINLLGMRPNCQDVLTDFPTYQWDHTRRYWFDTRVSQEQKTHPSPRHDLLGTRLPDSTLREPQWKNVLYLDDVPWLRDHQIEEITVFPMAGYLCMAMEACKQQASWKDLDYDRFVLLEISVHQALTIAESAPVETRMTLSPVTEGSSSSSDIWNHFVISSWTKERGWLKHCRGKVAAIQPDQANAVDDGTWAGAEDPRAAERINTKGSQDDPRMNGVRNPTKQDLQDLNPEREHASLRPKSNDSSLANGEGTLTKASNEKLGMNAQPNPEETAGRFDLDLDGFLKDNGFSGLDATIPTPLSGSTDSTGPTLVVSTAIAPGTAEVEALAEVVIFAQWLPEGVSRTDIESTLLTRGAGSIDETTFQALKRLPSAIGVLWVTGGLLFPDAGLVRGFARTLRSEFQMAKMVTLAIEEWNDHSLENLIGDVAGQVLFSLNSSFEYDRELAIKDRLICIPRLVQDLPMNQCLARETREGSRELQSFVQEGRPLKLTIANPGFLDTLCFVDVDWAKQDLGDNDIEISIKASGLNFKDVILALGQLAGNHLGQECSGVVTRVGTNVTTIRPDSRVCAIVGSSIANTARCPAHCAVPIPKTLSFIDAASVPIIYCTAHYCLNHVARIMPGETILIHAAAGGVGQAAIMLAQASKAKVFATVGSPDKKSYLMERYGIPGDCIFYSRDISFAKGVMAATDGKGVDVVLNSLAGDQLKATWRCMAPFGRFVEIGKRDITSNMNLEMQHFLHSVAFTAVDLMDLIQHRPALLQKVFVEVIALLQDTVKVVSPIQEFSISEVEKAFRSLQSGKLMGKLIIIPRKGEMVMATRSSSEQDVLRPDVSYLITGGTGGIGRAVCVWMAQHGAKNIILASRSGKCQPNTVELVEELTAAGVKVEVCQSDVAKEADVRALLTGCAEIMPPIAGIIHGAYVNKDALFEQATYQYWLDVVQPKFNGVWNLHTALLSHSLDFFIMLSSISGIVGNRGQAAYAAANSFLDDFAHYRISQGLAGTSIDLGVVKEIGYVADRPELQAKIEAINDVALSKAEVLALIKLAISGQIDKHADHQCIVGLSFEGYNPQLSAYFWATDSRFSHLRGSGLAETNAASASITAKQALKKARTINDALKATVEAIVGKFSSALIIPVEEINMEKQVVALGLDSLIAVEVRSWLQREMEASLSTMELMTASSIGALAEMVIGKSKLSEGLRSNVAAEV